MNPDRSSNVDIAATLSETLTQLWCTIIYCEMMVIAIVSMLEYLVVAESIQADDFITRTVHSCTFLGSVIIVMFCPFFRRLH